jgi:hypothetical protein
MPLAKFYIYSLQDFYKYVMNAQFTREITMLQNHHTLDPDYASISPENSEMDALEAMRRFHIQVRGWSDIAQNITTFPSGNIGLCRPIDITPAGIFGANHGAICIENLGNFDAGHDAMTGPQKNATTFLNAVLCVKFNLEPINTQVVYHHWFDKTGQRFSDDKINNNLVGDEQKTCPGTAFFGGNTIASAEANFYPLVKEKMDMLKAIAPPRSIQKTVNAGELNVRNGPGTSFAVLRNISRGMQVPVFITQNGWSKISDIAEEWVYSALLS